MPKEYQYLAHEAWNKFFPDEHVMPAMEIEWMNEYITGPYGKMINFYSVLTK